MSEQTQDIVKAPQPEINAFTKLPETFEEAQRYCEYLASSQIVPKAYQGKPQDIFVAVSWGQQVGLTNPMLALKNISVINGTPAMWGDAPLALVRRSPLCEFILEDNEAFAYARDHVPGWEHLKGVDPDSTSICVGKRVGDPTVSVREFSAKDVELAKLGNVHRQYPKDMRKYKARSRLLNSLFADVTNGIAQAELVKEQMELDNNAEVPEELKDGLQDTLGDNLADSLKDPESGTETKGKDVSDAEIIKEEENTPDEGLPPSPEPEWAQDRTVKQIIQSAKYLDKETANKLAKNIGEQDGKLTAQQAKEWQDEIRVAYEEHKQKKNS